MRPSSLRALLLALAMVLQTVAGGWGVARATELSGQALSAHCENAASGAGTADRDRAGHRHSCQSCCLCAAPSTFPVVDAASTVESCAREYVRLGPVPANDVAHVSHVSTLCLARGPPAPLSA